jgi:hypothetical protein
MPDYEEIIKQSQANVKSLGEKLKDLDRLHQEIKELKEAAEGIPEIFNNKFHDLVKLSQEYTNTLGAASKDYLDGNNTLFTTKLSVLATKIKEFEKEITRLVNTDFSKLFNDLQKVFIDQTRADLATELKRFEEKSKDLESKINELKKQIERLERIDLEKHFDKLQKTLAEIFGAINAINLTLTAITQTLTGIVQSVGNLQVLVETNFKETRLLINSSAENIVKHLSNQDREAKQNHNLLETKINALSEENKWLKKGIIGAVILQVVIFIMVIMAFKFRLLR